jgi:hypothetical protein
MMTRILIGSSRPRHTTRPVLETLEDRLVPSTMAGNYADGVWRFDTTAGWNHISNMQATRLDVDDAGDVYGKFSDGLWRWSASSASWMKLSSLAADQFQVTAGGVLYGAFQSSSVWRWDPSTGWMKLSSLDVGLMTVSDSDAFFGRFDSAGAQGLWRWTPTAGWSLLTGNRPTSVYSDAAGEFVGVFNTFIAAGQEGTWRWNPTTSWARLSTVATSISVSSNGAIYETRGNAGLWRAAPGAISFTQINSAAQSSPLLYALPDGSLYIDPFDPVVNHNSGYYWSPSLLGLGFVKIINDTSHINPAVIGKDGDLFFNADTSGTGYWSLQSPYHTLVGNTQIPNLLASQR